MKNYRSKLKNIFSKAVPLWMVLLIVLNATMMANVTEYYLIKRQLKKDIARFSKTLDPNQMVEALRQEVLPASGYKLTLKWKDLGKQLVESGAIDKQKYEKNGTKWKNVDSKLALSANYSSAQGAQRIKQSVQNIPAVSNFGGCGV